MEVFMTRNIKSWHQNTRKKKLKYFYNAVYVNIIFRFPSVFWNRPFLCLNTGKCVILCVSLSELTESDRRAWTGFIWLITRKTGGLLWTRNCTSGFIQCWKCLHYLPSETGMCSVELEAPNMAVCVNSYSRTHTAWWVVTDMEEADCDALQDNSYGPDKNHGNLRQVWFRTRFKPDTSWIRSTAVCARFNQHVFLLTHTIEVIYAYV